MFAWLRRRRRPLLLAAAAAGAAAVAGAVVYSYALAPSLDDAAARDRREARRALRARQRFSSVHQAGLFLTRSSLPPLLRRLSSLVDCDRLYREMAEARRNGAPLSDSYAKWELLKTETMTSLLASVYTICLLDLLLNVQLHTIGRYLFDETDKDAVGAARGGEDEDEDEDVDPSAFSRLLRADAPREFLALAEHIYNKGVEDIVHRVRLAVNKRMETVSLKQQFNCPELMQMVAEIRADVEETGDDDRVVLASAGSHPLAQFALEREGDAPPPSDPTVRMLLDETRDILDSPPLAETLSAMLDAAFASLATVLGESVFAPPDRPKVGHEGAAGPLLSHFSLPLARLLPALQRVPPHILSDSGENDVFLALTELPELASFCAMVGAHTQ